MYVLEKSNGERIRDDIANVEEALALLRAVPGAARVWKVSDDAKPVLIGYLPRDRYASWLATRELRGAA